MLVYSGREREYVYVPHSFSPVTTSAEISVDKRGERDVYSGVMSHYTAARETAIGTGRNTRYIQYICTLFTHC